MALTDIPGLIAYLVCRPSAFSGIIARYYGSVCILYHQMPQQNCVTKLLEFMKPPSVPRHPLNSIAQLPRL
jgi:hypothetical protein